jgi:pilus assembly protein CpaF
MNFNTLDKGLTKDSRSEINLENEKKRKKEMEEIASETLDKVIDELSFVPNQNDPLQKKMVADSVNTTVNEVINLNRKHITLNDRQKINGMIMDEIYGFGPITSLLNDPTVTEIMVNGAKNIYIERFGKIVKSDISFRDDRHVVHMIDRIIAPIGRRVDESSPMVDARLPDGSRVNIIIPPLSLKGPVITIRKFSVEPFKLDDLISFGTLSMDMAKFLKASVRGRANIIVSGGTGSGKTTFLNVMSGFIPEEDRIITIEDAAELQLQQNHVITLESRPANIEGKGRIGIRDLVVNSLRMRPDRIVVGEVRSGEALDMLQAMNTGHDGSLTTIHANSTKDTLSRLETMVMMAGMELPSRAIREQIVSAINLIIQVARLTDGTRKIMKITEIVGMEGETITLQDIFVFKHQGFDERGEVVGKHVATGIVPGFLEKVRNHGENISVSIFKPSENFQEKGFGRS